MQSKRILHLVRFDEDRPRLRGVLVGQELEVRGEQTAVQIHSVQIESRETIDAPRAERAEALGCRWIATPRFRAMSNRLNVER